MKCVAYKDGNLFSKRKVVFLAVVIEMVNLKSK